MHTSGSGLSGPIIAWVSGQTGFGRLLAPPKVSVFQTHVSIFQTHCLKNRQSSGFPPASQSCYKAVNPNSLSL